MVADDQDRESVGLCRGGLCAHVQPLAQPLRGDAGGCEHAPQVDDHRLADVLPTWAVERLGLATDTDLEVPVVLLPHFTDRFEQGEDITPLHVVADRMRQDCLRRAPVVMVEVDTVNHEDLKIGLAPVRSSTRLHAPKVPPLVGMSSGLLLLCDAETYGVAQGAGLPTALLRQGGVHMICDFPERSAPFAPLKCSSSPAPTGR